MQEGKLNYVDRPKGYVYFFPMLTLQIYERRSKAAYATIQLNWRQMTKMASILIDFNGSALSTKYEIKRTSGVS